MSKRMLNMSVAAMLAAGVATASNVASATPFADALAITKTTDTNVETVRWGRGRGFGWGLGAGLLGGAIVGGALAAPYYYGEPYYYSYGEPYYPPAAYGPGYYPAPGNTGDASYCAGRYRSYDPGTGTYLGYDGVRHPCP
jgi:BA14K-like protein